MNGAENAAVVRNILSRHLDGKASGMLMGRLHKVIEEDFAAKNDVAAGSQKIRMIVKLFVDEALAQTLYAQITSSVKTHPTVM